jgi:hypothetical protein
MRRLLLFITLLAAVPALVAVAGCGADDLEPVSVAEAAQGTRDAESARMKIDVTMKGAGLPFEIAVDGEGVASTTDLRMDMTLDLGQLTGLAGAGGDGRTRILLDGSSFYVDPPDSLEIKGGAQWVTADVEEVVEGLGVDADALAELVRVTPAQQIAALEAASDVEKVGEEEIGGEPTTHLRGTVTMNDYLKSLPADRRERVREALRQLDRASGQGNTLDDPAETDLWVDADNQIRKMSQKAEIPAQGGVPGGEMEIKIELSDFGTGLDLEAPGEDEVYDATDLLVQSLRQAGG